MKRVSLASQEAPKRSPSTKCGRPPVGWPMDADGMEWQSIRTAVPKRLRVASSKLRQRAVKRPVQPLDALEGGADRQPLAIDFLGVCNDAGDRAEPAHDPRRLGVGEGRQPPQKQFGIKLVGLAVDIQIGAREARREQRRAQADHRLEQLVDVAVLRLAQRQRVEAGGLQERPRVDAPGMRRAEYDGGQLFGRLEQRVGGRELGQDRGAFVVGHMSDGASLRRFSLAHARLLARPQLCQAAHALSMRREKHTVDGAQADNLAPA